MIILLTGVVIKALMIFTKTVCLTGIGNDDYYYERLQREIFGAAAQLQRHYETLKNNVIMDYLISFLAELLIYPTLICVMYGFINERAWQFEDGISGCYFIMFVYGVIMDALYMNFNVIWLVIRVICATYAKYNELAQPDTEAWKR